MYQSGQKAFAKYKGGNLLRLETDFMHHYSELKLIYQMKSKNKKDYILFLIIY